jgi:translation elongation factor EF-G
LIFGSRICGRASQSVSLSQYQLPGIAKDISDPYSEFAKVAVSIEPAEELDVVDNVPYRKELEALGVAWPPAFVFGLLDVVMFAEFGPMHKIRITLADAAYHEVDSSENAFREAGRDAGYKIIETVKRDGLIGP